MFEAVVVRPGAGRRFRLLTVSLAVHTLAVAAVVAAGIVSMRLPADPPRQMTPWIAAPAIPIAAGSQTVAARPRPQAVPPQPAPAPSESAPAVIPSAVEPVAASALVPSAAGEGSGQPGLSNGVPGGLPVTQSSLAPDAAGPLTITGNVKAPVVIRRVEPAYPPLAIRARISGWVVVRCVIDKTGHIRDAQVVRSSFAAFEQPAVDAVGQWLFLPGSLNGRAVDTIFELTVRFQMK